MTTRSTKLLVGTRTIANGDASTLYTVPANRRTIIRSTTILSTAAVGAFTLSERVNGIIIRKPILNQDVADVFEVWRVLHAGDVITLANFTGSSKTVTIWMSGAELVV